MVYLCPMNNYCVTIKNFCIMKQNILISSSFGHEIMATNFAKAYGVRVMICPNKEDKKEYVNEAVRIFNNMYFFNGLCNIVPFEQREQARAECRDIIGELKAGKLDDSAWLDFAGSKLTPSIDVDRLPEYVGMEDKTNVLFIPQKLVSDGQCGVTAEQQSLPFETFEFLKGRPENLVLGQHFNKVADLDKVQALAAEFGLYVPGMAENAEVFGIRGVSHKLYYNMYKSLRGSIGIAGTHTWYMLTMFPETPQIILFNEKGVERWKAIEEAYKKRGYNIRCIGFHEGIDMDALKKEIEMAYVEMMKAR